MPFFVVAEVLLKVGGGAFICVFPLYPKVVVSRGGRVCALRRVRRRKKDVALLGG